MRTTKSKNRTVQTPSGTTAEANASINPLLNQFFDAASFEETEVMLSGLLQAYISPDLNCVHSNEQIANTVHSLRTVTNLLRKLEAWNNQSKGGSSW